MSADQQTFDIGEKVQWTHTTTRGSMSISMQTWEGAVVKIGVHHLWVKRRGKTHVIPKADVTKKGQPSLLTQAVMKAMNP